MYKILSEELRKVADTLSIEFKSSESSSSSSESKSARTRLSRVKDFDYYKALVVNKSCVDCGKKFPPGIELEHYNHSGGWTVDGSAEKQWFYVTCPDCGYQNSLAKLGVSREAAKKSADLEDFSYCKKCDATTLHREEGIQSRCMVCGTLAPNQVAASLKTSSRKRLTYLDDVKIVDTEPSSELPSGDSYSSGEAESQFGPALSTEKLSIARSNKSAKMKVDQDCMKKYKAESGRFKGEKGERFKNCVKAFTNCATGVKSPDKLCAYLGRAHGKISSLGDAGLINLPVLVDEYKQSARSFALNLGEHPEIAEVFANLVVKSVAADEDDCGCS